MYYLRALPLYSKTRQLINLSLVVLTVLFSSCISEEDARSREGQTQAIDFSTQISMLGSDLELKVSSVRLLAFNYYTGELVKNTLLQFPSNSTTSLPITIKPDRYDLVYIANEQSELLSADFPSKLEQIQTKKELEALAFAQQKFSFELSQKATELPLSAYLPNQKLVGGSPTQPQLIRHIYLLRAVAKLTLNFYELKDAPSQKSVQALRLKHIASHFTLPALPQMYQGDYLTYEEAVSLSPTVKPSSKFPERNFLGAKVYYLPEHLIAQGSTGLDTQIQFWGDKLEEQTLSLRSRWQGEDLPYELSEINRMRLPIEQELALNSIVRNTHYLVHVLLLPSDNLAYSLELADWEWEESERNFDKGEISQFSINGDLQPADEMRLDYGELASIQFQVDQPIGAVWKATLSNGAHFKFVDPSQAHGIVTQEKQLITLQVTPISPWQGIHKQTEFYLTIDKKEIPIHDKMGIGQRYRFIQKA